MSGAIVAEVLPSASTPLSQGVSDAEFAANGLGTHLNVSQNLHNCT